MPKLHVIYDPKDMVVTIPEAENKFGFKTAHLSVPADLKSVDIYNLARRLAELLAEQL